VSELHGRVSRHMWHCLFPDKPLDQVPIGHVTNGIHLLSWMRAGAPLLAGGNSPATPTPRR